MINSGKEPLGYIDEWNTDNDPIGITTRGAGVGSITWQAGKYFRGNLNYSVTIKQPSKLDVRFLYHILLEFEREIHALCTFTGIPALNASNLKTLQIPIPPLEAQREIVRVLDNFTELTAELTARKKQYAYYRNLLLTFDGRNPFSDGTGVVWKMLGEICDVRDGTHDSPIKQSAGKYLITSKNIKNGTVIFDDSYYISEADFYNINKRSKVDINDLLFTMIGTVGEIARITEEPSYAIKNVGLIKTSNEILSRYLFHYLQSQAAKNYIKNNRSRGSQEFLSIGKLRSFPILLPNIETQLKIVNVLDQFDTLAHSISDGLPREIELRQKQYEYYREQLLTFA